VFSGVGKTRREMRFGRWTGGVRRSNVEKRKPEMESCSEVAVSLGLVAANSPVAGDPDDGRRGTHAKMSRRKKAIMFRIPISRRVWSVYGRGRSTCPGIQGRRH